MTEVVTETPAETPVETPVSIVGKDGNFSENWRESLPEEMRGEKGLEDFKNLAGLAKSFLDTKRMVGKGKIAVPVETSTEGEWEAFHIAAGRPSTPEDYNLKRPEELPEEHFSPELADKAQKLFHKIGLSQKQADALMAFNTGNTLTALQNQQNAEELSLKELQDGLHAEWGNGFEQKRQFTVLAVKEACLEDKEFHARIDEKFGADPDFIRFAANLGMKFAEHGAPGTPMVPTPGDYDKQINEITNSPAYSGGPGITSAQHSAAVDQVKRLIEQKYK